MAHRCNRCSNCKQLERIRRRALAVANPPFSHADQDVITVWNTELARLNCTGAEEVGHGNQ